MKRLDRPFDIVVYGATSNMIAETAIALLTQEKRTPGGIWTSGSALRGDLATRLTAYAGLSVTVIAG